MRLSYYSCNVFKSITTTTWKIAIKSNKHVVWWDIITYITAKILLMLYAKIITLCSMFMLLLTASLRHGSTRIDTVQKFWYKFMSTSGSYIINSILTFFTICLKVFWTFSVIIHV